MGKEGLRLICCCRDELPPLSELPRKCVVDKERGGGSAFALFLSQDDQTLNLNAS